MTSIELAADEMEPVEQQSQVNVASLQITSQLCWGLFLQLLAIGLVSASSVGLHFEGLDRLIMAFAAVSSLANFSGVVLVLPGLTRWYRIGISAVAFAAAVALLCFGVFVEEGTLSDFLIYNAVSLFLQAAIVALIGGTIRVCIAFMRRDPAESGSHFSLLTLMLTISGIGLLLGGARPLFVRMGWTSSETILKGAFLFLIVAGGGAVAGIIPLAATLGRTRRMRWAIVLLGILLIAGAGFSCSLALEYATSGGANLTTFDWIFYLEIQGVLTTIGLGPLLFHRGGAATTSVAWNQRYAIAIGLPLVGTAAALLLVDNFEAGPYDYYRLADSLALATVGMLAIVMTMNTGDVWIRVPVCLGLLVVVFLGVAWLTYGNLASGVLGLWFLAAAFQFYLYASLNLGIRRLLQPESVSKLRWWLQIGIAMVASILIGGVLVMSEAWRTISPRIAALTALAAILPIIAIHASRLDVRRFALFATLPTALLLVLGYDLLFLFGEILSGPGRDAGKLVAAATIGQTVILTIAILPLIWMPPYAENAIVNVSDPGVRELNA